MSRDTLLSVIAEQQTVIAELRRRVEELDARLSGGGPSAEMPGNKPTLSGVSQRQEDRASVVSTALPGSVRNPRGV